jgi:hypothetical protein
MIDLERLGYIILICVVWIVYVEVNLYLEREKDKRESLRRMKFLITEKQSIDFLRKELDSNFSNTK